MMPREPKVCAGDFIHSHYEGVAFFESKDKLRIAAQKTRREFKIPVRIVTIPRSKEYDTRYILMVSTNYQWPNTLEDFIKSQPGAYIY